MIARKDDAAEKAKAEGVRRVSDWLTEMLPDGEKDEDDGGSAPFGQETSVIVNQLACKEVGCPDVEVVMTLLRAKPRPKLMFKIYKAAAGLAREEVEAALQQALSEEQGSHDVHAHGHDNGDDHSHAEGGHDDGCGCGQEHGHQEHDHDVHEHANK